MRYPIIFSLAVFLTHVCLVQFTLAEVLNVPGDFNTIQEAIDNSQDGDIVQVAPGT